MTDITPMDKSLATFLRKISTALFYKIQEIIDLINTQSLIGKADKVTGATADNFASLDAVGNLEDSGLPKSKLAGVEDGATADQTGAEIKTAYEGESDTNAFTDAEKSKLSGIEASADVTDATNVDAAGATMNTDTSLSGNSWFLDDDLFGDNSAVKVASQQSIKAFINTQLATKATYVIGSYTGDGSTEQGITGVGTSPEVLIVIPRPSAQGTGNLYLKMVNWGIYALKIGGSSPYVYFYDNRINSLDGDGFTVDDDGTDQHPNKNGVTYDYFAFSG